MHAPISIIIPTLQAAAELPAALGALGEGLEAGLIRELIISDGGSTDATLQIAEAAGAEVVTGGAGRGGQLVRAAAQAQGDWLLVQHADTVLTEGWATAVMDHLQRHPDKAGYFRLQFRARGLAPWLVAGWANLRARCFGLPYGDQGLLISRALYDQVGGYAEISLMEDVAMARALKGRLRSLPAVAETSAARYQQQGWGRRGRRNLMTLVRYLLGADPDQLARDYRR